MYIKILENGNIRIMGWVGWIKRRTRATLVGYSRRSGIHPEGLSGDMSSQF